MSNATRAGSWGRREVLRAGGALMVSGVGVGCDLLSTDPAEDPDARQSDEAQDAEAPMLAQLVEAGGLAPVADRLPANPLVVEPAEQAGVYGGEWRSAMAGPADIVWLIRTIGYEQLLTWDVDFTKPIPNIAESVEPEDEGRAYTVRLREGMRWSDGEPFTADDIVFWYEDVVQNDDLLGGLADFTIDGETATLEKIDQHTVRFTFPQAHGLFLQRLATPIAAAGAVPAGVPRHYLQQFHRDYNDDIDALVEEEGFDDWAQLFLAKVDLWSNADLPRLHAWTITTPVGAGNQVVAERNPYYWKVDPDGRQLPYIDRVVFDVLTDEEVILLKATSGELDMHVWHINTPANKPILAAHRDDSDYRFFDVTFAWMNRMVIQLNLTCENQSLREVFQNKDFRIGLSHAINREEMIDTVFQRQGEPWQAAPRRESEFFDEEFAKQYTAYDVDSANEHLDRAGYAERDADGFRVRPDGQRISFAVDVAYPSALMTFWPDAMELVHEYWRDVGIDAQVNTMSRELFAERTAANQHDAGVWQGDGGGGDAILDPRYYFPFGGGSRYARPWGHWYRGGPEPMEEPPEVTRRQMELYDQLQTTYDEAERKELFRQILQIAKEEFYCMGTVLPVGDYGIAKNDFHNVPEPMILAWLYPAPGPTRPEQYFIDEQ